LKVLAVGASIAGLSCAESILTHNPSIEVTVVDKKPKVGMDVRCACGVSLYMLRKVEITVPRRAIAARIRRVRIYAPNGDYWELKGDENYGYVLDRQVFEEHMAARVEALGGEFFLNYKVTTKETFGWCDFVVGADGYPSVIAEFLRVPRLAPCDVHLGVQRILREVLHPQDTIELFFGEKIAPKGYAWIFPNGKSGVKVGLGVPLSERVNAGKFLYTFIEKMGLKNVKASKIVAKLIPTGKFPDTGVYSVGSRNFLLVGDALPSTDPLTGGGICQGIASGKAAGKAIAEGKPENYDRYLGWLRRQNAWRYRLKRVLFSFTDEDLNKLVQTMGSFQPKTLSVSRELKRGIRHIALRNPRSLIKILKALVFPI